MWYAPFPYSIITQCFPGAYQKTFGSRSGKSRIGFFSYAFQVRP